jgi:RNA polymerase sigma factor (sigma-70 family)
MAVCRSGAGTAGAPPGRSEARAQRTGRELRRQVVSRAGLIWFPWALTQPRGSGRRSEDVQHSAAVSGRSSPQPLAGIGGPDQFDALVAPIVPVLVRLAGRLTSWDQAEDVVQEALSRAWQKRGQFDASRGTVRSWLIAITSDQARTERRRARRRQAVVEELGVLSGEVANRAIADVDLERCLGRLSARQRLAIDCYDFADLPLTEVAVVMKCSTGTVKSTLADARRRLRTLLEETG